MISPDGLRAGAMRHTDTRSYNDSFVNPKLENLGNPMAGPANNHMSIQKSFIHNDISKEFSDANKRLWAKIINL